MNFILGTLFGIVISTIDFSGVTKLMDSGVTKAKEIVIEQVKE